MNESYSLCARCGAYWECGCTVQGRPARIIYRAAQPEEEPAVFTGDRSFAGGIIRAPAKLLPTPPHPAGRTVAWPDFESTDTQGRPVRITDQTLTIYPDVERDA